METLEYLSLHPPAPRRRAPTTKPATAAVLGFIRNVLITSSRLMRIVSIRRRFSFHPLPIFRDRILLLREERARFPQRNWKQGLCREVLLVVRLSAR